MTSETGSAPKSGQDAVLTRLSLAWAIGFMGLFSMLKGARGGAHAAQARKRHAGSIEDRALDPGSADDWVRKAVGERSATHQ